MPASKSDLSGLLKTAVCFLFYFSSPFLFAQKPKLVLPVGHTSIVGTVVYSPDGKYILTSSKDNTAKIWDAVNGELLHDLKGHSDWVNNATFSNDVKSIVSH
jgi:WD40 repeat protein